MAILDHASIRYQSEGELLDLVTSIAEASNLRKVKDKISTATRISYILDGLDSAEDDYLTNKQLTVIYQCLQDVSGITQYNTVPSVGVTSLPSTLVGSPGADGADGLDGFTSFIVTEIDTESVTLDQVASATYDACRWDYIVNKGANYRAGTVLAVHDGSSVAFYEDSTSDIGNTSDLVLSADVSSGNFRLRATSASDDWTVKGKRYLVYE